MPKDYEGLKTFLSTEPAFDTVVKGKSVRPLLAMLNSGESGRTVAVVVKTEDLLEAIGNGVRTLTSSQRDTLKLFLTQGSIDFRKPAIRAEIREVFAGKTAILAKLQTLATKTRTYAERFGFDSGVTMADLWRILPSISKSYMATYRART